MSTIEMLAIPLFRKRLQEKWFISVQSLSRNQMHKCRISDYRAQSIHGTQNNVWSFQSYLKDGGENDGIVMETREIELKDFLIF